MLLSILLLATATAAPIAVGPPKPPAMGVVGPPAPPKAPAGAVGPPAQPPQVYPHRLRYTGTQLCLTPSYVADGAPLVLGPCDAPESRMFFTFRLNGASQYRFADTQLCLDMPDGSADGARPQVWACNGGDSQKWTFRDVAGSTVIVGTPGARACLDVVDGDVYDGAPVQLWACDVANANQHWHHNSWK